ncbi:MAG: hypothetical protein ACK53F_07240 [Betaproteobacteria bacterium]
MEKRLDKILAGLKKSEPNYDRLKHLESDVWARIVAQRADQPVGVWEGFLANLFPARHRFASIMGAAAIGVVVGFGMLTPPTIPQPEAAEMLNFKVFKPEISGLNSIALASERL